MKRTILFKGKRVDNGEWVEGNLINWHPTLNPRIINGETIIGNNQNEVDYNETNSEVHPETVCQFTGLLDKNGKRIFEGDKIKTPYGIGKVSFYHACFMIEWIDDVDASMELVGLDNNFKSKRTDLEIIGNIHD